MEEHISKKEIRVIYISYLVLFLSMLAAFVPVSIASIFAAMICVCALAGVYSIRSNAEEDSITENHMTFLIRTFWWANLYLLISTMLAGIYLAAFADYSSLTPCVSYINNHLAAILNNGDMGRIEKIMKPCGEAFYNGNQQHVIITLLLALAPVLTYLMYRCSLGCFFLKGGRSVPEAKL